MQTSESARPYLLLPLHNPWRGRVLSTNQYQPNSSLSGYYLKLVLTEEGWGAISKEQEILQRYQLSAALHLDGKVDTSASSGDGGAIDPNVPHACSIAITGDLDFPQTSF